MREGKKTVEVVVINGKYDHEELEGIKECVKRAEALGATDFQHLNERVLDDETYNRIDRLKDLDEQRAELDRYIAEHKK